MHKIPILRWGQAYYSLEEEALGGGADGDPLACVSQANAGLIARDLRKTDQAWEGLQSFPVSALLEILAEAGELFLHASLPLGEADQSPEDYVSQLSATSGLPHSLCRRNMQKIHRVCTTMPQILAGLTRDLDLSLLDSGYGLQDGRWLSFHPQTHSLAVLLPSNSPGVNTLWLPAIPLKMPLLIKPGRYDPWTPYRLIQALIQAGFPAEALSFYPAQHADGARLLELSGRSLLFGGGATVEPWKDDPAVQIHGPGRSKVLIGPDYVSHWQDFLEVCEASIANNGGRSCINASTIVLPSHAEDLAAALAQRLAAVSPQSAAYPEAELAAFADPAVAEGINTMIETSLHTHGAQDVTARYREGPRLVEFDGAAYLLPTVLLCTSPDDPLVNTEFPFPFAAVLELPEAELLTFPGPSLVVTAITDDPDLHRALVSSAEVDRINLGPIPTNEVDWQQPHEGNLFDFLYQRRAFQHA